MTPLELIIVVGIVAILGAIAYPIMSSAKESAAQASCSERLRQVHAALLLYAADNPGFEAPHPALDVPNAAMRRPDLLLPYLRSPESLFCPETPVCAKSKLMSSYIYTALPSPESKLFKTAKMQMEEWFGVPNPERPIVHCLVHDELHFFPRERFLAEVLNPPFIIRLKSNGAIRKGRYPVKRGHDITRLCR